MSLELIRKALEKRLIAVSAGMPTVFENDDFTPSPGSAYQRANLIPNDPDNQQRGHSYIERGLFQIMLTYPYGKGSGAAGARAQALRLAFKRGLTLVEGALLINIVQTPRVAPALPGPEYLLPVTVVWECNVTVP